MPFNVLRTESKADLARLRAEITQDIRPIDFIEREYVEEVVCHTWDIRQYQRVKTGTLNYELRTALAQILNEILLPPTAMVLESRKASQNLSHGWLIDPESRRQVSILLQEAGLDESAIEAKAYTLVADDLEKANRMLNSAREGREKALRWLAKYRKSLAIQLRRNSDLVLAADEAPLVAGGVTN
jgi:transcriptional regulator of heat shock response